MYIGPLTRAVAKSATVLCLTASSAVLAQDAAPRRSPTSCGPDHSGGKSATDCARQARVVKPKPSPGAGVSPPPGAPQPPGGGNFPGGSLLARPPGPGGPSPLGGPAPGAVPLAGPPTGSFPGAPQPSSTGPLDPELLDQSISGAPGVLVELPMMGLPKTEVPAVYPIPVGGALPDMKIANTYVMPEAALSGIGPVAVLDGFNELLGPPPLPNGFIYHGAEIDLMGGSYGRIQGYAQAGKQIDNFALFAAYSGVHDDGWQKHAGAENQQFHGDLGWRGGGNEFHLIAHGVSGVNRGALLSPIELIAADPTAQLNYPNYFSTNSIHLNLTGNYALGDGWVARSNFSFGEFKSRQLITLGGAVVGSCAGDPNLLCSLGAPYVDINGNQFHAISGVKNYAYQEYLLRVCPECLSS